MSSPSAIQYGEASEDRKKLDHRPAIKIKLILAIPHVALKPALDEVQASLNDTVQSILAIHKGIPLWRQEEEEEEEEEPLQRTQSGVLTATSKVLTTSSKVLATPSGGPGSFFGATSHLRTFFKPVSENKEVVKLVSLMTTTISSAKVLVTQSLEHFKQYEELWTVDRNEYIQKFMKEEPSLSDIEAKLKEYTVLDDVFAEEEELLRSGSLALTTGDFHIPLCWSRYSKLLLIWTPEMRSPL